MAYKDVEEKSKAATKALLSEPDLDDKKNTTDKGCGDARQGKGKSKEKMKKKDKRKPKELQVLYTSYCFVYFVWLLQLSKATHV